MGESKGPPTLHLVAGAKAGDEAARAALYERYHGKVLSIVRVRMGALLRSRMESQDLVQSVMIESLKDLPSFEHRTEGAFLHWLSTLTERKIRDKADYLTAAKRDARRDGESPEEEPEARTPSRSLSQAEDLLKLEAAIRRLPQDQAELVVMAKLEGLSYEEIAESTGKSPRAARMVVLRAVMKLTDMLKEGS